MADGVRCLVLRFVFFMCCFLLVVLRWLRVCGAESALIENENFFIKELYKAWRLAGRWWLANALLIVRAEWIL